MAACLSAFVGSVCFTFYVNSNHVYKDKLAKRIDEYEEAKTFFESDVCQTARLKQQLGERNKCIIWERIVNASAADLAMNDWMEAYTLCKPGECLVTSFSMSQLITQVIPAIAFFVILVLVVFGYCVWDLCLRQDDREMEIPLTAMAAQIASQTTQMFMANMQQHQKHKDGPKND